MDNKQEDLGLGEKVIQENRTRFINKDGTFNVFRKGVLERGAFSPYHAILNASWVRFFAGVVLYYVVINVIFSLLYALCGVGAFPSIVGLTFANRFGQLFWYSIQVITTLGSSPLHPVTTMGSIVLSIEAMVGLLGFAMASGLMFARFSNPAVRILFSHQAVIAPYKNSTGFMVRMVNGRSNELINVSAVLTLSMNDQNGKRVFRQLPLEREMILVFPLNWTLVHPIDETSPLYGKTADDLEKSEVEFIVALTAIDQDLSKTIYVRTSYRAEEILVGAKFSNIIERTADGSVTIDPARIGEIEKA